MKNVADLRQKRSFRHLLLTAVLTVVASFLSLYAWAQDVPEKVDVDIEAGGGTTWYGQPWVWAVGVALFIIIIVAITRGGSRRDA